MNKSTYETFLNTLNTIVNESCDKATALFAEMNEKDKSNLNKLISWGFEIEEIELDLDIDLE